MAAHEVRHPLSGETTGLLDLGADFFILNHEGTKSLWKRLIISLNYFGLCLLGDLD
jgi:hypothetical protein